MSQAMLKLEGITKDYKVADTAVHALKGISLQFRKKEFVAVLGHSGCGKTTLLNIIGGLDQYTSGDLVIKGVSTKNYKDRDWDAYRNHSIGFVFQSYNLIPHQTVLGNVELALTLSGVSPQERRERAAQALQRVGLGNELNKKPNQLSGGQMQRVAIARALVNNPEILLADEPTGALDTETSIQIMDLIKEIAGERLVIMVTHNPELAKMYATRIVELKDGLIVSDSAPLTESVEDAEAEGEPAAEDAGAAAPAGKSGKKGQKKKNKTSMSFWTAFLLSGRNLLTKKGRTAVTSIAGSIGIISVCLVLALSNGFSGYINKTEEDMLSYYPLEITETALDMQSIMSGFSSASDMPDLEKLGDKIYVNSFLTEIAQGMAMTNNISAEYVDYVESMPKEYYNAIQKNYGESLPVNIYTDVLIQPYALQGNNQEIPTGMSLSYLKAYYTYMLSAQTNNPQYAQLAYLVDYLGDVVSKMPGSSAQNVQNGDYLAYVGSQYDVVEGRLPQSSDEAVIVIGGNNDMTDLLLAQLGFISQKQFVNQFTGEDSEVKIDLDYADLIAKEYTLFFNDTIYKKGAATDGYAFDYVETMADITAQEGEGVNIKVVGVLRLKDGMTYGCLSSGLNVTEQLVEEFIATNVETDGNGDTVYKSEVLRWMNAEGEGWETREGVVVYNVPANLTGGLMSTGSSYYADMSEWQTAQREMGGNASPNAIYIFPKDFATKGDVTAWLDAWNDTHEEADQVRYTDTVGLLMGMVQTILDAITYVLIAFTGISLVVSTVMIGVITYVSVVERTKEIGILRSIGARKKDIKHVFNAETFIIGLCAGLIGIGAAYLLQLLINAILTPLTGISGLAALPIGGALIMVAVSVVLTLISGLLPASAAAKRDPVVALRSE